MSGEKCEYSPRVTSKGSVLEVEDGCKTWMLGGMLFFLIILNWHRLDGGPRASSVHSHGVKKSF